METNYFYSQLNYPLPRTAIEAKILFAARVMQVRFLERLSGKTPREQNSSGKKIGAESAVLHFVFFSDHLGSAQFVTDWKGRQYEHIEYTPYGELWIEEVAAGLDKLPFRFTGKEMDEETGLYYYGARYLDPKYSRWLSGDPALGEYIPAAGADTSKLAGMGGVYNTVNLHLYHYSGNNPVKYTDPDGQFLEVNDNGDGTYVISGGEANSDKNIYIMKDGKRTGDVLGQMLTEYSFFDDDQLVEGAVIDTTDTSGSDFLNNFKENTPDLFSYMDKARNGKEYDFKDTGKGDKVGDDLNKYRHRGMQLGKDSNGNKIFGSARDVGNYAAGYVAAKSGLYWGEARLGFDLYQSYKSGKPSTEGPATQAAQALGYAAGWDTLKGKSIRSYRSSGIPLYLY